jgi:hypothetical protein
MNFIARVEEEQRTYIREIAGALEKLGARVKEVQPIVGVITGSSEVVSLDQLKIAGIASVELDRNWGAGMPEGKGKAARGKGGVDKSRTRDGSGERG